VRLGEPDMVITTLAHHIDIEFLVRTALEELFANYRLELHPEKVRMVDFRRLSSTLVKINIILPFIIERGSLDSLSTG
jgi:hypothetical protein